MKKEVVLEMFNNDAEVIRIAKTEDVEAIVDIIKVSFPEEIIEKTIYTSNKISNYLRSRFENESYKDLKMIVYEINNQIVGYIEFKIINSKAHLNYIVVNNDLRGKKIGKKMFKNSLKYLPSNIETIELSVFDYNIRAFNWYKRLGFSIIDKYSWLEKDLSTYVEETTENAIIVNNSKYLQEYSNFGFSSISIDIESKLFNVGILGEKYYKVVDFELLTNKSYIGSLKGLNIRSHIFTIVKEDDALLLINKYNFKKIVDSIILEISKEELILSLNLI